MHSNVHVYIHVLHSNTNCSLLCLASIKLSVHIFNLRNMISEGNQEPKCQDQASFTTECP